MGANEQLWNITKSKIGVRSETGSAQNQEIASMSSAKSPNTNHGSYNAANSNKIGTVQKMFSASKIGVSPSHFSLKATSYRTPNKGSSPCVTEAKRVKKKRLNIQSSILDDIRVDENGKHYLPN